MKMASSIASPSNPDMMSIGCKYRITSDITALIGDAIHVQGTTTLSAGDVVRVTNLLDGEKIAQVESKGVSYLVAVHALRDRSVQESSTECSK